MLDNCRANVCRRQHNAVSMEAGQHGHTLQHNRGRATPCSTAKEEDLRMTCVQYEMHAASYSVSAMLIVLTLHHYQRNPTMFNAPNINEGEVNV